MYVCMYVCIYIYIYANIVLHCTMLFRTVVHCCVCHVTPHDRTLHNVILYHVCHSNCSYYCIRSHHLGIRLCSELLQSCRAEQKSQCGPKGDKLA